MSAFGSAGMGCLFQEPSFTLQPREKHFYLARRVVKQPDCLHRDPPPNEFFAE